MVTSTIQIKLTELEWEVINQALGAPIRDHLLRAIKDLGIEASEEDILDAWEWAQEKWPETWSQLRVRPGRVI